MKTPRYLVKDLYTADPSAHVFNAKIYIYPSHDIESGIPENDNGDHFDMRDYHIFSMDSVDGEVTDHGVALAVKDIPWAGRQLWAPDVACKDGKYYLYFPLKDKNDIFRIGVAVSDKPEGPFDPQSDPIKGSFTIDPAVLEDNSKDFYIYFGGLWGVSCNVTGTIKPLKIRQNPGMKILLYAPAWLNSVMICWNLPKSPVMS